MNWTEFFEMGGYAAYVWPCFGLGLAVLFGNLILPWRRHRVLKRSLRRELEIQSK